LAIVKKKTRRKSRLNTKQQKNKKTEVQQKKNEPFCPEKGGYQETR